MSEFDWIRIRTLYERGESAYSIAKRPGTPSKQYIARKAKKEGWKRFPTAVSQLPRVIGGANAITLSRKTPENKAYIVELLKNGATYKLAAARVGISDRTLRDWREEDPHFAAECGAALAESALRQVKRIDCAAEGDWKAADRLLQVNHLTRDEWAKEKSGGTISGNTFNVLAHVTTGITRGRTIDVEPEGGGDEKRRLLETEDEISEEMEVSGPSEFEGIHGYSQDDEE